MPDVLNSQVVDEVTAGKFQNLGAMHTLTSGLSGQTQAKQQALTDGNLISHSKAVDQVTLESLQLHSTVMGALQGRVSRFVLEDSAVANAGAEKVIEGLSGQLAAQGAVLASTQQAGKIAATSVPETGVAQQMITMLTALTAAVSSLEARLGAKP